MTNRVVAIRKEAETESEILNQQRAEAAAAAERRRSTASDLRRLEEERENVVARIERHNQEMTEAGSRLEQLRASIAEIDRLATTVEEEKAREESQIGEATSRLTAARESADAMAAELAELNRSAAASRDARAAIEVQRAEALARVNFVRESCANELNQSLDEIALELIPDPEFVLETGRARAEELRERLENFGAVNMMALVNYLRTRAAAVPDHAARRHYAWHRFHRRSVARNQAPLARALPRRLRANQQEL